MNNPGALLNYVGVWSHIPLASVETNPFDATHLTPALQEGFRSGNILESSLPLTAAQCYVTRAKNYERGLLESLGLTSAHIEALMEPQSDIGDHFERNRYPWQENARAAAVAVAEVTGLHDAVSKALLEVKGWKKSIGFFPDGTDYIDVRAYLQEPLTSLQELLVERVNHALVVRETYDVNMEAGFQAYFYRYRRRHSGVGQRIIAAGFRVSDSTPPPAQAAG